MSTIVAVMVITSDGLVTVTDGQGARSMSADYAQEHYTHLLADLAKTRRVEQGVTPGPDGDRGIQGNLARHFPEERVESESDA